MTVRGAEALAHERDLLGARGPRQPSRGVAHHDIEWYDA